MAEKLISSYSEYSLLLNEFHIDYEVDDVWLSCQNPLPSEWVLFVSMRVPQSIEVLNLILPLLKTLGSPFKLVKNQRLHHLLNDGLLCRMIGDKRQPIDVRKGLMIFPQNDHNTQNLIEEINDRTRDFHAPEIPDATRIGPLLYIIKPDIQHDPNGNLIQKLSPKRIPFKAVAFVKSQKIRRKLYCGYYIPFEVLSDTLKGKVFKGISIRRLALNWCLIKIGIQYGIEDNNFRDAKTRVQWEETVLRDLHTKINVPAVQSSLIQSAYSCLILEYIEGDLLRDKVISIFNNRRWTELASPEKRQIIKYYISVAALIRDLHSLNYIHRDITPSNFIVKSDHTLWGIDFELAYCISKKIPLPPFLWGTLGYMSQNQQEVGIPTIEDDVYSLGALLIFMLTGHAPDHFLERWGENWLKEIQRVETSETITNTLNYCFSRSAPGHPKSVKQILEYIENYEVEITSSIAHTPSPAYA